MSVVLACGSCLTYLPIQGALVGAEDGGFLGLVVLFEGFVYLWARVWVWYISLLACSWERAVSLRRRLV